MWRMKVIFNDGTEEVLDELYDSENEAKYDFSDLCLNWDDFLEYNKELRSKYKGSPYDYRIWEE